MKYTLGDEVVIRNDLKIGEWYGKLKWTQKKNNRLLGKTVTIEKEITIILSRRMDFMKIN